MSELRTIQNLTMHFNLRLVRTKTWNEERNKERKKNKKLLTLTTRPTVFTLIATRAIIIHRTTRSGSWRHCIYQTVVVVATSQRLPPQQQSHIRSHSLVGKQPPPYQLPIPPADRKWSIWAKREGSKWDRESVMLNHSSSTLLGIIFGERVISYTC